MPGMLTSNRTASKLDARSSGNACSPVTASVMSKPSVPNVVRIARRMDGSSSTMRTLPWDAFTVFMGPPCYAWKRKKKCSAFSVFAIHPRAPLVCLRCLPGNGQAQARSGRPVIRSGTTVEALENSLTVFRPDFRAFVVNRDQDLALTIVHGDRNGRSGRGIFGRIVDELHDG